MKKYYMLMMILLGCLGFLTAQNYRVGDVYTAPDGSKGVVFYIFPNGTGGWVVALDDASANCAWGDASDISALEDHEGLYVQLLLADTSGYANTLAIRNQQNNSGYAAGVVDFAHGWYLPSSGQLRMLHAKKPMLDPVLEAAGGSPFANGWYWSSAEKDAGTAWRVDFGDAVYHGRFNPTSKSDLCHVRAMRTFTYEPAYLWSIGDTTAAVTVIPDETMDYTVTVYGPAGCSGTDAFHLTVVQGTHNAETAVACGSYEWNGAIYTISGTYTYDYTNAEGCSSTDTLHLTVHHSTHNVLDTVVCDSYTWTEGTGETYSISGVYTYAYNDANDCASIDTLYLTIIPMSVLNHAQDTVIIEGTSATLWVSGAEFPVWMNMEGEQLGSGNTLSVTPSVSTAYLVSNFAEGQNLVYNGDFEAGNTGFATDYIYGNTGSHDHYYVGHDIAEMWPWDSPGFPVRDHTSGNGQFLMVDGALQMNTTVWSQSIPVTPHTDYLFSAWLLTDNIAYFKYEINGVQTGIDYSTPETEWIWERYSQVWNSGTDTVAVVKIINRYSYSAGYDYAIDDITFTPLTECSVTDTIHVIVTGYPDNVDSADCTFLPEGTEWGIDQPLISSATALTVTTPMVGDIDDDGNQEILIPDGYYNMSIFCADGSLKSQFHIDGMPGGRAIGSIGLAKVKWQEGELKNIIVVFGTNKHIYAYDANGIQLWQTTQAFSSYNGEWTPLPSISFADFNHDGWTEIYVGSEIYDAATGAFLGKAVGNKGYAGRTWDTQANPYQTIAADLCGDYNLEMAIGNTVYAVDIQSRIDASFNHVTPVRQLPPSVMLMEDNSTIPFTDGNTSLIDINKDGRLDVLVMNVDQANRVVYCYIWDVETQTIICSKKIPNARKFGCPQMGDLDNDGNAEVCFMTGTYSGHGTGANDLIYALKYNELNSNREMDVFWTVSHGDNSACTGLTLFDFNQDGYAELVYRDISYLRIINGSLHHHQTGEVVSQPYDMAVYPCRSNTQIEYPIVVDVDGDGEAEIITSGANSMTDYGHVYIFKSAGEPWAPARKVWNQYMYNVTNVNEDLTIPQYQFNNALAFTDPEGVVRRPYNNFLQQATTIDQYGRPFYAVADVAMEASAFSQMQGNDTLALTFSYCNQGDNMLNAPYTVTIFANAYGSDTVCTFMVSESLPVDSCVQTNMSIPVSALCGFPNIDSLVIAVNCAGTGIAQNGGQQPECDTTNNTAAVAITLRSDTAYLSETACNSYFWYGDLLTQSGEYTHTLSNATGCVSVEVLNLTIIPMPTLRHTQDTVILAGTSATLWATGADYIYWTDDNDSLLYSGNTLVVNPETTTTYYLGGQNEPGCSVTDTIHVIVTGYPDNVDSADCVFFPEGTEWGIGQPLVSSASAITVTTPMVGDIDDDGQQEVVCPAGSSSVVSRINIFNADATLKSYFNTVGFYIWNSVGLAKVKWQGNEYKNIIVVLGTNKRLYAYDAQGTQLWQSNAAFQVNESTPLPAISFADFNHDGWTEIYIGGDIYDAATGVLLSRASGNKGYSGRTWSTQNNVYHTVVADFFGDCDLELVAGNTIYSVDIQSRTDFNANQMTVVKEVPPAAMKMEDNSSIPFTDGNTYLADMNLDGRLDVLVMNVDQSSRVVYLYVWDVETQSIICSKKIANARKFGTPQIGDINQDGYDEVCFIIGTYSDHSTGNNDLIYALQYNPQNSNGELDVFWTTSHSDNSACTGLTLFDFNQDGIAELVYRDRFNLRIINGSLIHHQTGEAVTQPYDIAVSPCGSATGIEYPLVVDVDLDGEAEIVVGGSTYETDFGQLYIFNSSGEPWAPARKVWNQYMYNVTNVNEDLMVPQYLFNNAMAFTDPEGVVRRPYNNFLQQATTIDQYGRPFYAVPDVAMEASVSSQMQGNDTLALTFSYCNYGDNTLNSPYFITIFADTFGGDTVCTYTVNESLPVDSCTRGYLRVPFSALCGFPNIDSLVIAVNCAGSGIAQNGGQQPECDTTNNMVSIAFSLHADTTHVTETACDTFDWYEHVGITQSGDYTHVFTNAAGCDSTVIMHLTFFHSTHNVLDTAVCDSYTWTEGDGETYAASGVYTYNYTNADGCASTDTLHLTIIPLPVLSHTQDTVIIDGTSATLWASGADYLYWTDGNDSIISSGNALMVTPESSAVYYLNGQNYSAALDENVVSNGDFELGNVGFSSAYNYNTNLWPAGNYYVGPNAHNYHSGFYNWPDHTTGVGNYMIINGAESPNTNVWTQTVSVSPNTNYAFSVWVCSVGGNSQRPTAVARLQFSVNGVQVGDVFTAPESYGQWGHYYEVWNSGEQTSAIITILNQNTAGGGNDFGVDDISFIPLTECSVTDTIHVVVTGYPDNVMDKDCVFPPDSNAFEMVELFQYPNVNSMSTPMVADMDGDGLPEIIACCYTYSAPWYSTNFHVLNGQTGELKYDISTVQYRNAGQMMTIADVDYDGKSELFLMGRDRRIYCYNYNGGIRWSSANVVDNNYLLSATDVNNDGQAEIVCGKYIYNAQTGALLLEGNMVETGMGFGAPHSVDSYHPAYFMYALGDVDGDGTSELCAGNTVYKMHIVNSSGTIGNSWSILRQASLPDSIVNKDGETFIVDFDNDGDFDICVIGITHSLNNYTPSHTLDVYVWDGQTSQLIAHRPLTVNGEWGASIPYSGDLNGDGFPEIIFAVTNVGMLAYTYDTTTFSMRLMHNHAPFGETSGFTVFDFNQDGRNEIVYRGTHQLYIVDGVTLDNLSEPITAYSGTVTEYPVVADVNADGHAEIIVTRAYGDWFSGSNANGWVSVYGSQIPGAWSSARKVWNQWAYNSVNINEDMTVPQHRFDISTTFPNGKKPFNSFLRQMPYIDSQGDLFNAVADVAMEASASMQRQEDGTFVLTFSYCNQGDNTLNAPYSVTVFANGYSGDVLAMHTVNESLPVDSCVQTNMSIPVSALCGFPNLDSLVIAVNCAGTGIAQNGGQQPECDTTNNTVTIAFSLHADTTHVTETACDTFDWYEHAGITQNGDYSHVFTNASGCDSTVVMHLTFFHSTHNVLDTAVCENYTWTEGDGETYATSGVYTYNYTNADGCASVDTLHLTIIPLPVLSHTQDTVILAGTSATLWATGADYIYWTDGNDSLLYNGNTLVVNPETTTNVYYLSGQNEPECSVMDSIHVIVTGYPDNVDSADCVFFPEGTEWGIEVGWSSANIVSNLNIPLVGDLDNDGHPEIICFSSSGQSPNAPNTNSQILVFDGVTKQLKTTITMPSPVTAYDAAAYGMVKLPSGKGLIVTACYDFKLRAYDITASNPDTPFWISDVNYGSTHGDWGVNVSFADFNHDGHPEVYVRNKIYSAETGALLVSTQGSENSGSSYCHYSHYTRWKLSSPMAADVCDDPNLELILGNEIYGVNIVNPYGTSGNTINLVRQVTPPNGVPVDGNVQVADFNSDGFLDVFISIRNTAYYNGYVYCYVWDVHQNTVSTPLTINTWFSGKSIPMLADIDNDGLIELLIQCDASNSMEKFRAYKYLANTQSFNYLWGLGTDEDSYSNGITSFDFNQDGLLELMICDQSTVRIVNGSGRSHVTQNDTIPVYVMGSFPFSETTIMQYPIIVDVDADGNAEIVSVGSDKLNILESSGPSWAPARKVWNQYMYNVTNVNEDLTIPQYQFNNALAFTDPEGVVRRPYNNFLQQATTIDQYGRPFYAVPDVAMEASASSQMQGNDTLALTFSYCNYGDNTLNSPYFITIFADTFGGDTVCTYTVNESLPVDSCTRGYLRVPFSALCGFPNIDSLVIAVNCAGSGIAQNGGQQPECDTTNNMVSIAFSLHADTTHVTETACDTFDWYEHVGITQSGDYTHVFTNAAGCDSTVIMHLTVFHSTHYVLDTTVCESYTWTEGDGETYTTSGLYTFNYTNGDGCASADTLHLTILYGTHNVYDTTVCESYTWTEGDGETYTTSGLYTFNYTNGDGCASADTLHLTILYGTHHVLDTTVCESYTWTEGDGETYTTSGVYTYNYTNGDGCASADTLHLTILYGTHNVYDTTVCESYTWTEGDGETYTTSGLYTFNYTNVDGCASADTLHLTILYGTHNVYDTTVCESYTWTEGDGETYTTSGLYTYNYTNGDGCASADTLHLTILYGTHHVLDTTVCESYTWTEGDGETYTTSGVYTYNYTNGDGCASADTLHLTILYGTHHVLDTTVCENYTWTEGDGETYTTSGTYTYNYTNADGCASTDTLHLIVRPLPVAIINGSHHLCEDSSIVLTSDSAFSYLWNTGETTQSIVVSEEGTYTVVVSDEYGCASDTSHRVSSSYNPILNVNIPDMCAGGSYTISVGHQQDDNVQLGGGATTLSMTDTVFLPDGVPCDPHGCSYRSPLTFTAYGNHEVVESVEDIYYVRLNMEHSWAGDIYINITCPNGQKADIMKYGGNGISACNSTIVDASRGWQSGNNASVSSYFGLAYDIESSSYICDPNAVGNEQGIGWNYCWSNNTTQGYTYAPGDGSLIYRVENEHNGTFDSSNVAAGTHFYHPDQSFSSLIGCPLNGSWYIEVIDGWDVDNGYIFGWELALRNEVITDDDAVFTAATSDGPWITSINDSLFRLDPPAGLTQDTTVSYTFHVFDDFGCQYDTTVEVLFYAPRHTLIDTVACSAIVWNGVLYSETGAYHDTLVSSHGCDSIVTLNLTINQCYIEQTVDTMICASALPYTWHGHLFALEGEWIDTLVIDDGLSLITTYQLSVSSPAVTEMGTNQVTCYGGTDGNANVVVTGGVQPYSYQWTNAAGTTVSTTAQLANQPAGTYTFYASDAIGCTATQTINLTHLSDSMVAGTIPQTQSVCMGNTLPVVVGTAASGGVSNVYQWQISTNGVNWDAAPIPNNSQNYNYPNAVTSSFFLRRAWISQTCGTVYSNAISVSVLPIYADTIQDAICQGYAYQNNGFDISEAETAASMFIIRTRQLQSSQGCDSSVTLLLTVIAHQHTTITDGICQHSSYQANGFNIEEDQLATAGEYVFAQQYMVNDCDSMVILHLTVYPEYEVNIQDVICEGDGYHQQGFNVPAAQTVGVGELELTQVLQSQHTCDSVVNLHLTVVDTSIAIVSLTEDFCEEYSADLTVVTDAMNYVWSTGEITPVITVTQPGMYTVTAIQDNCSISAWYQIQQCEFNVYLPNAITPGLGDGLNDYFCIHDKYKPMIEDFEIRIYSRWGELVYYSKDKDFKWNGEVNGRINRQIIYNYLITFTDKRGVPYQLTGSITVL